MTWRAAGISGIEARLRLSDEGLVLV